MNGMSPAQKLVLGFTAALLGSNHALITDRRIRQQVGMLKKDLTENLNITVSPQLLRKENVEGFVEAVWKALNVLTRNLFEEVTGTPKTTRPGETSVAHWQTRR
jgi:hypothetical protein